MCQLGPHILSELRLQCRHIRDEEQRLATMIRSAGQPSIAVGPVGFLTAPLVACILLRQSTGIVGISSKMTACRRTVSFACLTRVSDTRHSPASNYACNIGDNCGNQRARRSWSEVRHKDYSACRNCERSLLRRKQGNYGCTWMVLPLLASRLQFHPQNAI
jgi:hypothetical protein